MAEINIKDIEPLNKLNSEMIELKKRNDIQKEYKIQKQKRREYEKSCVIDRELILNSLTYIINHYEKDMSAKLEKNVEWSRSSQWSELTSYQILTINFNDKEICFKVKIDSDGCYPDEEYCGVYVNMNKHSNVCFFEIKNKLSIVLKNSNFLLKFMNSVEEMYLKKQKIITEDIQQLLVNISNDNKSNQKVLKLNKKDKIIL